MDTFDRIEQLMKERGLTQAGLARATGISTGLISQWKKRAQLPSSQKLAQVAEYFGVSVDYLLGKQRAEGAPIDIAREVDKIMADLENSGDLMFDGDPASPEAVETIRSAMAVGVEMARRINREKGQKRAGGKE